MKKATRYFDDDDEIRNAKMMVRDILKPAKHKVCMDINQKIFGLSP